MNDLVLRSLGSGSVEVAGELEVNGSIAGPAPVALTPAASVTITKADHEGRILTIASTASANDSYLIPVPTRIGESYRFVWSGVAADADNIILRAVTADAFTFSGGLLDFDGDADDAAVVTAVYPGADDDKLTLTDCNTFDITLTATSLTNYLVSGYHISTGTASAFGDIS